MIDLEESLSRLRLCQSLSGRYPALVFWKHLERGLSGCGDIDALAPEDVATAIIRDLGARKVLVEDQRAIVRCKHAHNLYPLFFFDAASYPNLFQLDITFEPLRLGLPWCDTRALVAFSELNSDGIRVLRPGALSLVLMMLYGVARDGMPRVSSDDRAAIGAGWVKDREGTLAAVEAVLPPALRRAARSAFDGLGVDGMSWNTTAIRQLWRACAAAAVRHHAERGLSHCVRLIQQRRQPWCELATCVHCHGRVAQEPSSEDFLRRMRASEDVLREGCCAAT